MRQRVMIAMAIACNPKLLIADEPTTALDATIQAQILDLLRELQAEFGLAIILITHDLGVVADLADRVMVMYAGRVVETAETGVLFDNPSHPYTNGLLESVPEIDDEPLRRLKTIPGTVPNPFDLPSGCRFAPRCSFRQPPCDLADPPLVPIGRQGHTAACIRHTDYRQPPTEPVAA
jgi:peptide/nickel transport system ATP-binding protein/oligopeptide transport system ATP-binding protein